MAACFRNLGITCFFTFMMSSCINEIKLNIDKTNPTVIVDGQITDSLTNHVIRVHKSAVIGIGNDNILDPIQEANVAVVAGDRSRILFVENKPGIYVATFAGKAGNLYHVEIVLPDGQVIKSSPQVLLPAPPIGPINTEIKDEPFINASGNISVDTRLILKMNTDLTSTTNNYYLRWRASGEYEFVENYPMALSTKRCYVKNNVDLNNLKIFDTRNLQSRKIIDEPFINTTLDYRFANQYCFHIQQFTMSEAEFNYWDAVQSVTNIDGSLFDAPPGTVTGNLSYENKSDERVVGYFSVNGVKSTRFFANPQSLNQIDIEPKCRFRFNTTPSPDCYNCLLIDESTLVKPPYWIP